MRLLLIDPNSTRPAEQVKAQALADRGLRVTLLAPRRSRENYTTLHTPLPDSPAYRLVLGRMAGKLPNRTVFLSGLLEAFTPAPHAILTLTDENFWLSGQALAARRFWAPESAFVCHSWQNLSFDSARHPQPSRILYASDSWVERRVFSSAAAIMARNRAAQGVLRRGGYQGEVPFVPWAVDTDHFRPKRPARERPFTIGFVGRFVEEKGLHDLMNASALLDIPHRLLLVGAGPLAGEMEALAGRDSQREVVRLPVTPHQDMPGIYGHMDVLALPSRTTHFWAEQFGRVLVEAMACAVPVVGSNSGAIPEVIGDAGLVYPEGEAPALAAALSCLADPGYRKAMSRRGLDRAREEFSWAAWARKTESVLRRSLAGGENQ